MVNSPLAKRMKRASTPGSPPMAPSHSEEYAPPHSPRSEDEGETTVVTFTSEEEEEEEEEQRAVRGASPGSQWNGVSSASIYAPSRHPRRLEAGPTFTVVGDSIMEEEGSIDLAASTRSLMELYLDYNEENGRRYCGAYFMPNDELEQTRLYLSHQVYLHIFDGEPTAVPLQDPKLILDIGTGTGDWATLVGERFPSCEVIGTDISAIQTSCPPYNVFFEIEDAELPWLRQPDSVDLVHMRNMAGAFRDWRFIYEQAFECLRPGGWLEIHELHDQDDWGGFFKCFPPDAPIHKLQRDLYHASVKAGRPRGNHHLDPGYLVEAGFTDVETRSVEIPITVETGAAGKIWLIAVVDGIEALCLRPLTKYMGWDPEYTKNCCEESAHLIAQYAKDPELAKGLTVGARVVIARKPETPDGCEGDDVWREGEGEVGSVSEGTSVPAERTPAPSITEAGVEGYDARARAATVTLGSVAQGAGEAMEVDGGRRGAMGE